MSQVVSKFLAKNNSQRKNSRQWTDDQEEWAYIILTETAGNLHWKATKLTLVTGKTWAACYYYLLALAKGIEEDQKSLGIPCQFRQHVRK